MSWTPFATLPARESNAPAAEGEDVNTPHSNGEPPPAFATTSTETIDFSIGFGLAALIYVSLESLREFYVDFVDFCREIRVFTRFGLPYLAKCHHNIANPVPHDPNWLGTDTKALWTILKMDLILLLMEEMEKLMELMKEALSTRHTASLLQKQQQQHHHHLHQLETLRFASAITD
jgi:hypothetical protein